MLTLPRMTTAHSQGILHVEFRWLVEKADKGNEKTNSWLWACICTFCNILHVNAALFPFEQ